MTKNISYQPKTFLSKYIDRFYIFEKSENEYFKLPVVLPGTGLELLYYLDKTLSVNGNSLPKAHTVCPREIFSFDKIKNISFISVRFKSGAFRHFTSTPFTELNNKYVSIIYLWKNKGEKLLARLQNTTKTEAIIDELELFLVEIFNEYHDKKNDKWDAIIDELYYNFENNSIHKLAENSRLSLRQFERGFKSQFGITAKGFQKITRFQNVIKQILLDKNPNYLHTILDNGYFDQSHFIKEFRSLTKKTPMKYFNQENFDSHFYHVSINNKPVINNN
ncbi:helix-turn-helix domain-containing protein [Aquimarina algicola]|uniref:Helix-turn-helix transcriptional regulator n=1 Tax=Aquimarina algicola TaxID=2589995 RepID=A0A504J2N7_9FLAO|nr:AraC family transcriptional regulator [Aquimarina algicola]TPN85186.1 helix-turn-helix transcriptional regulator [Aquimarina algicola]